jgi:dihydroorotate dehydrogenase (NAD+) catalytic subunit
MGIDLSVKIGKLELKNPVMVSSGTFGYGEEYEELVDLRKLGALVTKSITLKPKEGNPPPRIIETPAGLLNSIGLENVGLDNFIKEKLPFLKRLKIPIIVSIAAESEKDYLELAESIDKEKIEAIELNVSCPNIKSKGGFSFAQDKEALYKIVKAVRKVTSGTLITKLSPNVTDIKEMARVAQRAGSEAISLVNTFLATAIDIEEAKPKLANFTGGLSGPAIKPIALRLVYEAASTVDISVIGQGGIMNTEDALEFLLAGADAISLGTANFIKPKASLEIIEGLKAYMNKKRIRKLTDLIGSLKV